MLIGFSGWQTGKGSATVNFRANCSTMGYFIKLLIFDLFGQTHKKILKTHWQCESVPSNFSLNKFNTLCKMEISALAFLSKNAFIELSRSIKETISGLTNGSNDQITGKKIIKITEHCQLASNYQTICVQKP